MLSPKAQSLFRICINYAFYLKVIPYEVNRCNSRKGVLCLSSKWNIYCWHITKTVMLLNQGYLIIRLAQATVDEPKQTFTKFILQIVFTVSYINPCALQILLSFKPREIMEIINECFQYYAYIYGKKSFKTLVKYIHITYNH